MVTIGVVAAELGVSTATLRKWESRYGRPVPQRSTGGARLYDEAEVAWLRVAKRQMDAGVRPADAMAQATLRPATSEPDATGGGAVGSLAQQAVAHALTLLCEHRLDECHAHLVAQRQRLGLVAFADGVAGPLAAAVGEAWARGDVQVFEEHGFSAVLRAVLEVRAFGGAPDATVAPVCTVLLATLSGEQHTLGLAMVQAVLQQAGARCVNLGAGLPEAELVAAAQAFGADVVGVSLSLAMPERTMQRQLLALRESLPGHRAVWAGGAGAGRLRRVPEGVQVFATCAAACLALDEWRLRRAAQG